MEAFLYSDLCGEVMGISMGRPLQEEVITTVPEPSFESVQVER